MTTYGTGRHGGDDTNSEPSNAITNDDNARRLLDKYGCNTKPERADELAELLHHASEVMRNIPGFISANLHVSEDKTRVVNYPQWRAKADLQAMYSNPEALPHLKSAADLAESYDPVLYTLRFSDGTSSAAR